MLSGADNKHTDSQTGKLDWVGLPQFGTFLIEYERREDHLGDEDLDLRLEECPGRLWLDTIDLYEHLNKTP